MLVNLELSFFKLKKPGHHIVYNSKNKIKMHVNIDKYSLTNNVNFYSLFDDL